MKPDLLDRMNAFEDGEMTDEFEVVRLFQNLIDSGLVWSLQGSYRSMAEQLIDEGYCHESRRLPARRY